MMRGATLLWAGLAVIAGSGLFLLKYEVQGQEQRLAALHKDIADTQESIHVLKAEWSYLNDPQRLREQAERHLDLHPMKPSQIAAIASLPMAEHRTVDAEAAPPPAAVVRTPAPATAAPAPAPVEARRSTKPEPRHEAPVPAPKAQHKAAPVRTAAARPAPARSAAPVPAGKKVAAVTEVPRTAAQRPPAAHHAPSPAYRPESTPVTSPRPVAEPPAPNVATTRNVMVITSPALMQPEMASTRVKP